MGIICEHVKDEVVSAPEETSDSLSEPWRLPTVEIRYGARVGVVST